MHVQIRFPHILKIKTTKRKVYARVHRMMTPGNQINPLFTVIYNLYTRVYCILFSVNMQISGATALHRLKDEPFS